MDSRLLLGQYRHVNSPTGYFWDMAQLVPKTFGERVRFARKDVGMTQVQLAARAKIGQSALSSIETGDTQWSRGPNLLRLAQALNVEPSWLETGAGPMRPMHGVSDHQFMALWNALTPENRRRLVAMCHALLGDQAANPRPTSAEPFPTAPKPGHPRKTTA